jgi:two-component system phosphate regulon response regulator PhoB/two-component system alkaline phosphatase synthesis response regulator PhoP
LILLDLMLPGENGLDICKQIRKDSKTNGVPVIFLTAKTDEIDRVLGFELGADDYVTKPFSLRELVGRIKAILRRSEKQAVSEGNLLLVGKRLKIDVGQYKVFVDEGEIALTTTEFRILTILAENPAWVFSRQQILEKLWGHDKFVIDRTIDVHIRHLREKLGDVGLLIKNIRGIGYKIEA